MLRSFFLSLILSISFPILSQTNYEVTHYTVEDGLISNSIQGVFEDSLGIIWLSHLNGFSKLHGDHVEIIKSKKNLIVEDYPILIGDNYIWGRVQFNTDSIDLIEFNFSSYINFSVEEYGDFTFEYIYGPVLDGKGNYWLYNNRDSLTFLKVNAIDTISYQSYLIENELQFDNTVRGGENFVIDNKGGAWIRTSNNQIHRFNYKTGEFNSSKVSIPDLTAIWVLNDSNFIAEGKAESTNENGIYVVRSWEKYFHPAIGTPYLIENYNDTTFFIDREGLKYLKDNSVFLLQEGNFVSNDGFRNSSFQFSKKFYSIREGDLTTLYKLIGNRSIKIYQQSNDFDFFVSKSGIIYIYGGQDGIIRLNEADYFEFALSNSLEFESAVQFNNSSYFIKPYGYEETGLFGIDQIQIELVFKLRKSGDLMQVSSAFTDLGGISRESLKRQTDSNKSLYLIEKESKNDFNYKNYSGTLPSLSGEEWIIKIDSTGKKEKIISRSSLEKIAHSPLSIRSIELFNDRIILGCRQGVLNYKSKLDYKWTPYPDSTNVSIYRSFNPIYGSNSLLITLANDSGKKATHLQYKYESDSLFHLLPNLSKKEQYELKENQNFYSILEDQVLATNNRRFFIVKEGKHKTFSLKDLALSENEFFEKFIVLDTNVLISTNSNENILFNLYSYQFKKLSKLDGYYAQLASKTNDIVMLLGPDEALFLNYRKLIDSNIYQHETWDLRHGYKPGDAYFINDSSIRIYNPNGYLQKNIFQKKPTKTFKIHFKSCRVNYDKFNWSLVESNTDSFSGNIMPYDMNLTHDQNHLTFDYQGVSHSNKEPLVYYHKMVGMDTNFVGTTSKSATYSNLEPGEYTFKVFAQDENENQSRVIECSFTIAPPYWETWWFISLMIIIGGSSLYSGYQWRVRALKERQLQLESEVESATLEIRNQKAEIEESHAELSEAHREITDSIAYAKRIQGAILPPLKLVKEYLNESFVLYKPKDVVAGDFYWMQPEDGTTYFAAADCTGHGVPGAMVSVVCNNALNRSVKEFGLKKPGEILDKTRELVITEFEKSEEEVKDGMDIALVSLKLDKEGGRGAEDESVRKIEFAGAHNPLWLVRKGEFDSSKLPEGSRISTSEDGSYQLAEIKANKQPIGQFDEPLPYTTHQIELKAGDSLYIFSDGYVDQFGGEKGKKFKSLNFKNLILSIQEQDMEAQRKSIDEAFEGWRGELEQIDDVCVIGVRV